ncbi:13823_t:CDS:1, partial [Cetraspora pellucida]
IDDLYDDKEERYTLKKNLDIIHIVDKDFKNESETCFIKRFESEFEHVVKYDVP